MKVEVVYAALPVIHKELTLKEGASVKEALLASNIFQEKTPLFETLTDLEERIGIFGKKVPLNTVLKPGDRIEIYRFLYQDPKEARRRKAKEAKKTKKLAFIPNVLHDHA